MDLAAAAALCQLNTRFYEQNASSFSITRQSKWPGWERVAEAAGLNEVAAADAAGLGAEPAALGVGAADGPTVAAATAADAADGLTIAAATAADAATGSAAATATAAADDSTAAAAAASAPTAASANSPIAATTVATAADGLTIAAATAAHVIADAAHAVGKPFRVLDLACGNLRFEQFLESAYPQVSFEFAAVDNCDGLVAAASASLQQSAAYRRVDLTEVLLGASLAGEFGSNGEVQACAAALSSAIAVEPCDLAVAFGFLHHLPLFAWRVAVLRALVGAVKPGGLVAASLWEFMNSPQLAEKAVATHAEALVWCAEHASSQAQAMPQEESPGSPQAQAMPQAGSSDSLQEHAMPQTEEPDSPYRPGSFAIDYRAIAPEAFEEGDWLLGWNNQSGQYRYCHSFTPGEVDELLAAVSDIAQLETRFHADGRTDTLNEYLILRAI